MSKIWQMFAKRAMFFFAIKDGKWKGYVAYPNIDLTTQMVDALESTRAYEANVGVMDITKNISRETLTILA